MKFVETLTSADLTPAPKRPARQNEDAPISSRQWRQIGLISLGAIAVFSFLRWLPTGTNLSHMDFRVDAKNSIEFCDPLNPQFIPVVAVASPVAMTISADAAKAGQPVHAVVTLKTASGKPITREDLLVVHTQPLHLMIIDETLTDYQHVHPAPMGQSGTWAFAFTPRRAGEYRLFADFTPSATGRGLYANTQLSVAAATDSAAITKPDQTAERSLASNVSREGFVFELTPTAPIRAKQPADIRFTVSRPDGAPVPLELVMDAYAHLVAFDEHRMGFAHLHPTDPDISHRPDALKPTLNFKITIPTGGRYVIWAQVNVGGRETFVPFWFDVAP